MPVTSKKKLAIELRRKTVAANILAGLNYREIAEALKPPVSIGTISKDVKVITDRLKKEQSTDYAEYLQIELRRLDLAMNGLFPKVKDGNTYAIETMLKVQDQRLKLTGHPAAVKTIKLTGELSIDDVRAKRWAGLLPELAAILQAGQSVMGTDSPQLDPGDDNDAEDAPE